MLGGAAVVSWPLAGRAQQPPMPVIGYICTAERPRSFEPHLAAYQRVSRRAATSSAKTSRSNIAGPRTRSIVCLYWRRNLVRRKVNVIAALGGPPSNLAAKNATTLPGQPSLATSARHGCHYYRHCGDKMEQHARFRG